MQTILKRFLFAAALLALGAAHAQVTRQQGNITTQNLVAAGTCTTGGCVEIDVSNRGAVTVQVTGTYTGALSGQATTDGVTWVTLGASGSFTNVASGSTSATISSGSTGMFRVSGVVGALRFRIAALAAVTGTATITLQTAPVPPESSTTISGGAGDASAANQVTGNASLSVMDDWDETDRAKVNIIVGQAGVAAGAGAVGATVPRVTLASDDPAVATLTRAQGSTTAGQTGPLTQGAVTTSAPTYTTGQTNPLSLTTAGGLRVDGSGATQPVSGTVAATQSGNWTARLADGSGNALTSATRGSERAISVQIVDGSGAQVTTFGGSGGTASTVGSATPSTATAIGGNDGTNMQVPRVADIDTGGGTQYALITSPRIGASGGGVELTGGAGAVAAGTLRVTQASDSPLVATLGATSDAAATQGSTGTVSAKLREMSTSLGTINTSLGTLNTSITADPNYSGVIGAATAPTRMLVGGGVYNSTPLTLTNGQSAALQVSSSGALLVSGAAGATEYTEDAAAAANPQGPMMMAVRRDTLSGSEVSADGDNIAIKATSSGQVHTFTQLGAGSATIGALTANQSVNVAQINGVTTSMGNGVSGTGVQRVTIASDSTGVVGLAAGSNVIGSLAANQSANVAQINGVTPLMGAGNTGTGSPRVTIATDQAAIATAGHGATGAAVPSGATQMGVRTGANMEAATQGATSVAINVSTATTTQLVALASSQQIRVTGLTVVAGGTGNITFVYGTGSNCGTGTTSLSGAIPLVANVGFTMGAGLGPVLIVPASQALCITTSAAVQMSGWITYAQY